MKEPNRLVDGDASNAERTLLRSASMDGPPAGVVDRMMTALEGAPGAQGTGCGSDGTSPQAPVATRSLRLATLTKPGILVLLGAAGLSTGVIVYSLAGSGRTHDPAATAPPSQTAPAPDPIHVPGHPEGASLEAKPPAVTRSETANGARQQPSTQSDDSLGAELRLLDAARAAVNARNPTAAQRALDSYAERFPQGHLKPEATVLRLAVLVRHGDHGAAMSLGRALLADEVYRTYESRIRSLLREIPE